MRTKRTFPLVRATLFNWWWLCSNSKLVATSECQRTQNISARNRFGDSLTLFLTVITTVSFTVTLVLSSSFSSYQNESHFSKFPPNPLIFSHVNFNPARAKWPSILATLSRWQCSNCVNTDIKVRLSMGNKSSMNCSSVARKCEINI